MYKYRGNYSNLKAKILWNHLNLWWPIFEDCGIFAYLWGSNFVDASVFSFSKKDNSS